MASLKADFARGIFWFYLLRTGTRLLGTIQLIIVANYVPPSDFGLIGIALLVIGIGTLFSSAGLDAAIIQSRQETEKYLSTVWWISTLVGLLVGILIWCGADIVSGFFEAPRAKPVLQAMASVPIVTGMVSAGLISLNKTLAFKKLVLFEAVVNVSGAIVAITLAIVLQNVWALVAAAIVTAVLRTIGSFLVSPFRPTEGLYWRETLGLFRFAKWIVGGKVLHYGVNQGDDWIVGKILGVEALGLYKMAYRLGNMPTTEITAVLSNVAFPVFSRMEGDVSRIRAAYLRVFKVVALLSTPVSVAIFLFATDAVSVLLGSAWLPMVGTLQILVVWGWVRSFRALAGPVFNALGFPKTVFKLTAFKLILLLALLFPMVYSFGLEGAAWAVVIASLIEAIIMYASLQSLLKFSLYEIIRPFYLPLVCASFMTVVVLGTQSFFATGYRLEIGLIISVVTGFMGYVGLLLILDHLLSLGVLDEVKTLRHDDSRPKA